MTTKPKSPTRTALEELPLGHSLSFHGKEAIQAQLIRNALQRMTPKRFSMEVFGEHKSRTFTRTE